MSTTTPMEVKKDGLRQTQDGIWKLTVTVHPNDMTTSILRAPMGTRYGMALVEIGDDEKPAPSKTEEPLGKAELVSRHFQKRISVPEVQDFVFQHYAAWDEEHELSKREAAARRLKRHWEIESSSDLDTNPKAAQAWMRFYTYYEQEKNRIAEER